MKLCYAVVFEQTPNNYCAYAPDVQGCVSVGDTWSEMQANIREALAFHIEGMVENGEAIPEPRMSLEEAMAYHSQAPHRGGKELLWQSLATSLPASPQPSKQSRSKCEYRNRRPPAPNHPHVIPMPREESRRLSRVLPLH